jgi:hypothetical protein
MTLILTWFVSTCRRLMVISPTWNEKKRKVDIAFIDNNDEYVYIWSWEYSSHCVQQQCQMTVRPVDEKVEMGWHIWFRREGNCILRETAYAFEAYQHKSGHRPYRDNLQSRVGIGGSKGDRKRRAPPGSKGTASGARPPYLQKIFEIDLEIFYIGKNIWNWPWILMWSARRPPPPLPHILDPPLVGYLIEKMWEEGSWCKAPKYIVVPD